MHSSCSKVPEKIIVHACFLSASVRYEDLLAMQYNTYTYIALITCTCTLLYVDAGIGIFYYMLGNIDPRYRSNLHVIQLLCVVPTPLLKKYGINEILEPFMTDIKDLESVSAHVIHKLCFI